MSPSPWFSLVIQPKLTEVPCYKTVFLFFFLPPPTPVNGEIRTTVSPSSWNWSQATLPESALECQIPRHFSGCETLGLPVYKSWNQIQANTQLL